MFNMKIRSFFIIALSSVCIHANAQYAEDALRFSQTTFGGTARIQAIGGAQNAIGADISNLTGNPAGLGFYRGSDFSITPSLRFGSTESRYFGNVTSDQKDNFNIGSLGVVLTQLNQDYTGEYTTNGWVSYSFAFGMNRINNFHSRRYFQGLNPSSSLAQRYAENANANGLSPVGEYSGVEDMAFDLLVIDGSAGSYYALANGNQVQEQNDLVRGAQNEWTFAFGANYSNKLYLGASVGIGSINYDRETQYKESEINDTIYGLSDFTLNEDLNINGSGVNLKVGLIFRPVDFIRIGASAQTPTWYGMEEGFSTYLRSTVNDTAYSLQDNTINSIFEYDLRTPARFNGGLALFFNKNGFISADIEYVNYSKAQVNAGSNFSSFKNINNTEIRNSYQGVFNYRIGAEYKIGDIALRGGYALYGDPYKNQSIDRSKTSITGGLGYRIEDYYFDVAYVHSYYNSLYSPYFLDDGTEPTVTTKYESNSILFTIGTRF
jgi:hypothetical protein